MNTRLLFIISLCVAMLATWFYRSQDSVESRTPMSATNVEFEATHIDALQTNEQGRVAYLLTADEAIHFTDTNQDNLTNLKIDWQLNAMRRIQLNADHGIFNQNTGDVRISKNVEFVSMPVDINEANTQAVLSHTALPAITKLQTQELIGNLKTNQVRSDTPIIVTQTKTTQDWVTQNNANLGIVSQGDVPKSGHQFESASFKADLNTGEYEFEQVAVVFNPPQRQDVPLF